MSKAGKDEQVAATLPKGKAEGQAMAEMRASPFMRHGMIANSLASFTIKTEGLTASSLDVGDVVEAMAKKVGSGDLHPVTDMLLAQSIMLDVTTTELMRRAWQNAGEYPDAFDRYMNLALKSQKQSRAALEALSKVHAPREQMVRHVHVHEGGQAVAADEFHHHAAGGQIGKGAGQAHAQSSRGPALPGPNPLRQAVPVADRPRKEAMPNARRRSRKRRTEGE